MKVVFAGTPAFAVPTLSALLRSEHNVAAVLTQPDRRAGRGRALKPSPVKQQAVARGARVLQPEKLKDPQTLEVLARLGPDVLVVVAYGQILPVAVLETPRFGCVNVHASLLPRWRGAAPIQRAILAGDRETGVSIMQMEAGLDTGAVYASARCCIEPGDTAGTLHDKLAALGPGALLDVLAEIEAGRARPHPQDETQASYAARIDKAEARIDWSQSAVTLARLVRAFNPTPVAFTTVPDPAPSKKTPAGAARLKVWAAAADRTQVRARPGTVLDTGAHGIDIATGAGCLRLLTVQPAGSRPMAALDFLNAHPLAPGTVLGLAPQ